MAFTRKAVAGLITVAAGLGLAAATTGTAAAAESGSWRAYGNTNPITSSSATWHCAGSKTIATSVLAQVCAIRSASGASVQGAVIVRNNRTALFSAYAAMDLYTSAGTELGLWSCASSGVAANSWSVCFGRVLTQSASVNSMGTAKGVNLGTSPFV
ncbi:hypothetical protein ACWED2_02245 [Amycolatopsis sp. NPDC005003]